MVRGNKVKDVRLTIQEVDQYDDFRDLSPDQKEHLITLVYEVSLTLYKTYGAKHD
ncbi:hypothetical protein ACTJJB_22535 [Chitinophaga sp. 22536]|uniref:hypothetical protein n=1 Tax=unclassified Chitinophaga TaxID=2619133 RepID=UPI003F87AD58